MKSNRPEKSKKRTRNAENRDAFASRNSNLADLCVKTQMNTAEACMMLINASRLNSAGIFND